MSDERPQIDLRAVRDDVEFRTSVLVHLQYIGKDLEEVKEGLKDHIEDDRRNFGTVNQKIDGNSGSIAKGAGIVAAIIFMIGLIFSILQMMKP